VQNYQKFAVTPTNCYRTFQCCLVIVLKLDSTWYSANPHRPINGSGQQASQRKIMTSLRRTLGARRIEFAVMQASWIKFCDLWPFESKRNAVPKLNDYLCTTLVMIDVLTSRGQTRMNILPTPRTMCGRE